MLGSRQQSMAASPLCYYWCWPSARFLTFALTIGSGGSGGVFAPSLFTGAMLGGFLGQVFHQPTAAFVVVGMAAVFGGAARVPIATLLMVTEMTGGYHLLVAGALAVILSSVVQAFLSSSLKYQSLYEAQVPSRPYSPAHRGEQLRIALDLLRTNNGSSSAQERGLELISLLASGVPVSLPDNRQMKIGVVRSESLFVGQPIDARFFAVLPKDADIILVLRRNRVLGPRPDLKLEAGDQLVAITTQTAWEHLLEVLDAIPQPTHRA